MKAVNLRNYYRIGALPFVMLRVLRRLRIRQWLSVNLRNYYRIGTLPFVTLRVLRTLRIRQWLSVNLRNCTVSVHFYLLRFAYYEGYA